MISTTSLKQHMFEILKKQTPKRYDGWAMAQLFEISPARLHMTMIQLTKKYPNIHFERKTNEVGLLFYYEVKE